MLLRKTVTSFTTDCVIDNEKYETLRDALARLCVSLHPLDGSPAEIIVDPAPGFSCYRMIMFLSNFEFTLKLVE